MFISLVLTSCQELPGASSSAAFAVFNSTETPESKLAASSQPLLCPMHLHNYIHDHSSSKSKSLLCAQSVITRIVGQSFTVLQSKMVKTCKTLVA
jgi:hypothetical protein